jgi:hypothetical protein
MATLSILLLVTVGAMACSDERPEPAFDHSDYYDDIIETSHLPPVITIQELLRIGLDTTTIYEIEPHVALLNDALVTLAELKRSYDATSDVDQRNKLNAYAIPFHITADRHHQTALNLLDPPLDSVFDRYVEGRKKTVGLADWHADHRQDRPSTELPGPCEATATKAELKHSHSAIEFRVHGMDCADEVAILV